MRGVLLFPLPSSPVSRTRSNLLSRRRCRPRRRSSSSSPSPAPLFLSSFSTGTFSKTSSRVLEFEIRAVIFPSSPRLFRRGFAVRLCARQRGHDERDTCGSGKVCAVFPVLNISMLENIKKFVIYILFSSFFFQRIAVISNSNTVTLCSNNIDVRCADIRLIIQLATNYG